MARGSWRRLGACRAEVSVQPAVRPLGSTLVGYGATNPSSFESHAPHGSTNAAPVAAEEQAGRSWCRLIMADCRAAERIQLDQMADQRLEVDPVAGRGNNRVGLDPAAITEHHVGVVKAVDRRDNLDPPALDGLHEAVLDGGSDAALMHGGLR